MALGKKNFIYQFVLDDLMGIWQCVLVDVCDVSYFCAGGAYMAISEDLRSVQAMLGGMESGNAGLVRLLCDNLAALADQVEALEGVPLAPQPSFSSRFASGMGSGRAVPALSHARVLLQ